MWLRHYTILSYLRSENLIEYFLNLSFSKIEIYSNEGNITKKSSSNLQYQLHKINSKYFFIRA